MGFRDVAFHSPQVLRKNISFWEDTAIRSGICEFLDPRVPCYSGSNATQALNWMGPFIEQGENFIWAKLLEEYDRVFNPANDIAPPHWIPMLR